MPSSGIESLFNEQSEKHSCRLRRFGTTNGEKPAFAKVAHGRGSDACGDDGKGPRFSSAVPEKLRGAGVPGPRGLVLAAS
jgi:hypothetical protein